MELIKVYILAWNRPQYILKAIDSVLNQSYRNIEVVVSDNSTNNKVQNILTNKYLDDSRYKYIKREPPMTTGIEHMNRILDEVDTEYFIMFHDDDTMHSNMIEKMYSEMLVNDNIIAIGTNANVVKHGKQQKKLFMDTKTDLIIENCADMLKKYLKGGIAPFPSYMYRKSKLGNQRLDFTKGHKWCDAAFIVSLSQQAPILYISDALMDWYAHEGQDSLINDFIGNLKLIKFYRSLDINNSMIKYINRFRIQNICIELKQSGKLKLFSKSFFLFLKYSPTYVFPRYIYYLLNKS